MSGSLARAEAPETTRQRILDVAEGLFAREGVEQVTLRAITATAGVNVAAVHYHFGSKDELLRAIFVRRMQPLLEERARRLSRCPGSTAEPSAAVEAIVRAYVEPTFEYDCAENEFGFNRLIARLAHDSRTSPVDVFSFVQDEADRSFIDALSAVLPHLPEDELLWRLSLVLGMLFHAMATRARIALRGPRTNDPRDMSLVVPELIRAGSAVFLAPPAR